MDLDYLWSRAALEVDIPESAAVMLEGSIAEGFGNSTSDIDFLVIVDGAGELPTMPSVLFIDQRRVEVRTRSLQQIARQAETVRRAFRSGTRAVIRLPEDLLNRCQRILGSTTVLGPELAEQARNRLPVNEFQDVLATWWAHQARQSLRWAIAMFALGQHNAASGWARVGLLQSTKSWAARRGETYLEPKWLPAQLDRIGDTQVTDQYWEVASSGGLPDSLALAEKLGVTGCRPRPDRISVQRVRGITTWIIDDTTHVIRDRQDVFVLGPQTARAWRSVVFGRPLTSLIDIIGSGDKIAEFLRLGLIELRWRGGGTITRTVPLCGPVAAITPASAATRPLLCLAGAVLERDGVNLVPLPANRFAAAGMAMVWSNVLVENAREDLVGALDRRQWRVAEITANRMLQVACRGVLSAYGVHPLPPDVEVVESVGTLMTASVRLEPLEITSPQQGQAVLDALDGFVSQVRDITGATDFPAAFDSAAEWRRTLEIGCDWLRLGAHLDATLPIDEARDLLATGGRQPHTKAPSNTAEQRWLART